LKLKSNDYENKTSKFDLTLMGYEAEKKILFLIEYSTKLFKQETIERFIRYFRNIVFSVIQGRGTGQKIAGIDILPGDEKKQLLVDFNDMGTVYPKNKTLHRLFEEQAERTPDSVALIGHSAAERHAVSYRGLN
jgi:non-ribosomal peptide synthetase component F